MSPSLDSLTWLLVVVAILLFHRIFIYEPRALRRLPPGPKPKLFTGNLHQLPVKEKWKAYKAWSHIYGPIFSLTLLGKKMIVLNTFKAATDLLEARSNIYSDRPRTWMYSEIVGRKLGIFVISSQHPRHKIYRRLLHSGLNSRAISNYQNLMEREAQNLAKNLLESPDNFLDHIRQNAGAVILQLAYGYKVTGTDDAFVSFIERAFVILTETTAPGRWLVDSYPILRFLPSWFPGGSFKVKAEAYRKELLSIDKIPFDWAKQQINSGDYIPSFTSQHLLPEDDHKVDPEEEDIIKWCSSALYLGGVDTTVAFMTGFIAAMVMYPLVQGHARREVDQVLGSRKPRFEDQASMPYISALIKEVLRWATPVPLGLPHCVTEDDLYLDYFIPKGTTIIANIWGISKDEDLYPNPMEFSPERYLGSTSQLDPRKFIFGFGRRVCPGAAFVEALVFVNITTILSLFTLSKAVGPDGNEITPKLEFNHATTSHIKPFPCLIKPRVGKDFSFTLSL